MVREFREETGKQTSEDDWHLFCILQDDNQSPLDTAGSTVYCYTAKLDTLNDIRSITDEQVEIFHITGLPEFMLPNLHFLVPAADLYLNKRNFQMDIRYFKPKG